MVENVFRLNGDARTGLNSIHLVEQLKVLNELRVA